MFALAWSLASRAWPALARLLLRAAVSLGSPGLGEPARPHRLRQAVAIALPAALFAWWLMPQLILVMSPSIGAWVVRPSSGPIRRGDLVMFLLSHPLAGPVPIHVTKQVLCLPGDRLTMIETPSPMARGQRDGRYFCEGRLLGISKVFGRHGQRLAHFAWRGSVVPAGQAYVGSHHEDGFDSRYFGFVPLARLQRLERVL